MWLYFARYTHSCGQHPYGLITDILTKILISIWIQDVCICYVFLRADYFTDLNFYTPHQGIIDSTIFEINGYCFPSSMSIREAVKSTTRQVSGTQQFRPEIVNNLDINWWANHCIDLCSSLRVCGHSADKIVCFAIMLQVLCCLEYHDRHLIHTVFVKNYAHLKYLFPPYNLKNNIPHPHLVTYPHKHYVRKKVVGACQNADSCWLLRHRVLQNFLTYNNTEVPITINKIRLRRNGRHFTDIFKIYLWEDFCFNWS